LDLEPLEPAQIRLNNHQSKFFSKPIINQNLQKQMKSISTAIYMLIAIVVILLAFTMTKPVVVDAAGKEIYQIKLFNFKKLA
jgi:hypothetical protein